MKKLIWPLLMISSVSFAAPYKIVMMTDSGAKDRADEFKKYLLTKPPFNKLDPKELEFKVVTLSQKELNCGNRNKKSPRVINCDDKKLNTIKAKEEANLAMVFTSAATGASGGDIPKASKTSDVAAMMHEMLHTFGCADEYEYSASEAEVYCSPTRPAPNIAFFKDRPPYKSDSEARVRHAKDVPWMGRIDKVRYITQGSQLGSSAKSSGEGNQVISLYRGGSCNKVIPTWRPYPNSIMKGYTDQTIYPFYEEIIVKGMESQLGRKLKFKKVDKPSPVEIPAECPPEIVQENIQDFSKIMRRLAQ